MTKLQEHSFFVKLCEAAEAVGWEVRIYDGPVVAVCPPEGGNYSRTVQAGETFDRCAEIVLNGLQSSKVLPK